MELKLLYGTELEDKQKECESKGFTDVAKSVLKRLVSGETIYRCEVVYLLSKMS